MTRTHRYPTAGLLAALLLAPILLAGCGHTVRASSDDATITARVKTILLNDADNDLSRIDVDTFNGVVTLTGSVKSAEVRDRAVAIARRVNGVSEVKSALQIQQQQQPPPTRF